MMRRKTGDRLPRTPFPVGARVHSMAHGFGTVVRRANTGGALVAFDARRGWVKVQRWSSLRPASQVAPPAAPVLTLAT